MCHQNQNVASVVWEAASSFISYREFYQFGLVGCIKETGYINFRKQNLKIPVEGSHPGLRESLWKHPFHSESSFL